MASKDPTQALQDLVVDSVRRSQEAVTDLMRSWRSQWESGPFGQVPGSFGLPPVITLEQVDAVFDLAERVLAEQRRMTKEMLVAAMPALAADTAPRSVRGTTST